MTTTDTRALTIIATALAVTAVTAQAYASSRAPYGLLVVVTLGTVGLVLAWARVRHLRDQRSRRHGPQVVHTSPAERERLAHGAIDAPGPIFKRIVAAPEFGAVASSGIRATNGYAATRVRYPEGPAFLVVAPDGYAAAGQVPPDYMLGDAAGTLAHIATCQDRLVSHRDRAIATAAMQLFEYRAKHTRRLA